MPRFIVQFQGQESVAELKPGANSVGRQSSCTIPLKDSTLSRLHCEVILAGTVATLLDKGSRNGTLLNGKKIEAQVLQPGDKIQIGATTLWYEKKNVAHEAGPAPSTRRSTAQATPQSDSGLRKAQGDTGRRAASDPGAQKPATAAVRPSAPAAPPTEPQLQDFAFHGKAGGNMGKVVAALMVVAALGVGGWFAKDYLKMPTSVAVDADNLVGRNAQFDVVVNGKPDGWAMRPSLSGEKSSCTASVDAARGRNNGSGLALEKAGGSSDLVAECAFVDDLTLRRGEFVNASAWTQFDTFNGWAALKVEWLRSAKGAVIAEEYSDPVKASSWTEIRAAFQPPAAAGAFRFSLALLGRSGRAFFDDVSVKTQPGAQAPTEKRIGKHHKVNWTRAGVLQVDLRGGRRTVSNISLRLESEKEGASPQAFASDVTAAPDESGLGIKGRMINPLDFKEVGFEVRVSDSDEMTNVAWQFAGDSLKQVDRVTIAFTLPRVDGPPRLPENGDPVMRFACGSEDGDFAIEYETPAQVKFKTIDGRIRIYQTWKVEAQTEDPVFGFRIREKGGAPLDPLLAIAELRKDRKYGEAVSLARDQAKKIREAALKEKMESEVRALEEAERRDWAETQAAAFTGVISRRPELVDKAREILDRYSKQWSGEGSEGKAETLRRQLEKDLAATPAGDAERPHRIFDRAKKCVAGGKRSLAQSLLQTLVARYPSSDVTPQAQELLKSLSQ
jgi:hypothetical protein